MSTNSGEHKGNTAKSSCQLVLQALDFAAGKHCGQVRKNPGSIPYVNHLIEVATLLATVGGVSDPVTLQAAILHDTLEDTETTPNDLESAFGVEVRSVVEEVSDDRRLPKAERARLQIQQAPHLSKRASLIRLADKVSNLRSLIDDPPPTWSSTRRRDYIEWTAKVIEGCRGNNPALERLYDSLLVEARVLF
jgi:(p)ppGpp synthase/HD superfamily hydrolase